MKLRSVFPMKIAKYGYIIVSTIFCIVGIAMIMLPRATRYSEYHADNWHVLH